MGLDVTYKLLCYFAMALGNDGITHLTIKSCSALARIKDSTSDTFLRYILHPKGQDLSAYCLGHCTTGRCHLTTPPNMDNAHQAWPMIDNSGRRLTTINNTMSCLHVMTSSLCVVMVIESPLLISHVQFESMLRRRGMG